MFDAAEAANTVTTWILRFVGLMMMFIGLKMIVSIFSVIADVIPFIGNLVGGLTGIVAFLVALSLSLVTIAVAWLYYRPLIGGALLIAAIAIFYFAGRKAKSSTAEIPDDRNSPNLAGKIWIVQCLLICRSINH